MKVYNLDAASERVNGRFFGRSSSAYALVSVSASAVAVAFASVAYHLLVPHLTPSHRIPTHATSTSRLPLCRHCRYNSDPNHASCSVPQELPEEEIDRLIAERAVEEEEEEKVNPYTGPQIYLKVTENVYIHRDRCVEGEDDIMVCQCRPPAPGSTEKGCGPSCINRTTFIECVEEHCPCGSACSNRPFSRKQFAPMEVHRAGGKGFGLFAHRDEPTIPKGNFLLEYVGEVVEESEYDYRKQSYLAEGQRHFYFMNVGTGEVIDACTVGNVGRFLNHSCAPNCETQKWNVRGEVVIGLFALRDIAPGEELTFDYNFERYGDKPIRCLCGTSDCRTFIGGTGEHLPDGVEFATLEECDEDPEPILVETREQLAAAFREHNHPALRAGYQGVTGDVAVDAGGAANTRKVRRKGAMRERHRQAEREKRERAKKEVNRPGRERRLKGKGAKKSTVGWSARLDDFDSDDSGDEHGLGGGSTFSGGYRKSHGGGGRYRSAGGRGTAGAGGARGFTYSWQVLSRGARRSEVDRKLASLTAAHGGLRGSAGVPALLRLFHLCDLGATD